MKIYRRSLETPYAYGYNYMCGYDTNGNRATKRQAEIVRAYNGQWMISRFDSSRSRACQEPGASDYVPYAKACTQAKAWVKTGVAD